MQFLACLIINKKYLVVNWVLRQIMAQMQLTLWNFVTLTLTSVSVVPDSTLIKNCNISVFNISSNITLTCMKVSYACKGFSYLIINTKTVILWNNCFLFEYILKYNLFLWYKAVFSAWLLQSSVSHDPSEIMLICSQETFFIIINVNHSCVA